MTDRDKVINDLRTFCIHAQYIPPTDKQIRALIRTINDAIKLLSRPTITPEVIDDD